MSALDDELQAEIAQKSRRKCKVCRWLATLPDDVRKSFDDRVGTVETSILYRACKRLNPPMECGMSTFRRHVIECPR